MYGNKEKAKLRLLDKPPHPATTPQGIFAFVCSIVGPVLLIVFANYYIVSKDNFGSIYVTLAGLGVMAFAFFCIYIVWIVNHVNVNVYENHIDLIQTEWRVSIPADEIKGIKTTDDAVWKLYGRSRKIQTTAKDKTEKIVYSASRTNRGLIIETPSKKYIVSIPDTDSVADQLRTLYNLK